MMDVKKQFSAVGPTPRELVQGAAAAAAGESRTACPWAAGTTWGDLWLRGYDERLKELGGILPIKFEEAILPGAFLRVLRTHDDPTRAGMDGLVVRVTGDGVELLFGLDRYGRQQRVVHGVAQPVLVNSLRAEWWPLKELDLTSLENSPGFVEKWVRR